MEILHLGDTRVSFGCERICSSVLENINVPRGGGDIYPHIKLERDPSNIFRVRALTSSGSTGGRGRRGGGDAKTIISPNTSLGYNYKAQIRKCVCIEIVVYKRII